MSRKRIPLAKLEPQRIGIIKPSALGDIVHSLPVLTALRRRYPNAYIAWVVNRAYEALLRAHTDLDETICFDRRNPRSFLRLLRRIRRQEFNLVIDLQGLARSGLMTAVSGAPRRVGLATAREGARWAYSDVIRVDDFESTHAVDRYWKIVEALGGGEVPKEFRLPVAESARAWVLDNLQSLPRPWIAFAVGARWETKRWPPVHFAEIARMAQMLYGGSVILVGGADETVAAAEVRGYLVSRCRDLTAQTDLPQLVAVLDAADVVVSNDSGPLHIATALGRPVVAPYTCTQVIRTGPFGALMSAVETTVWCRGSCVKQCTRLECMSELTPQRLWPVLEAHLRKWECNRRSA